MMLCMNCHSSLCRMGLRSTTSVTTTVAARVKVITEQNKSVEVLVLLLFTNIPSLMRDIGKRQQVQAV